MKIAMRAAAETMWDSDVYDVHPLTWAFEEAKKLDFDALELILRAEPGGMASWWDEKWKTDARCMIEEYGISISSLCSGWAWSYSLYFTELKEWASGIEFLAQDARLASDLGAPAILVHFGTSRGSNEECKALLKDVAAIGEENGVAFGYEANIWAGTGMGNFDDLLRMVDAVASPGFGVYLHNGYPRAGLPLHEEIEKAGDRLVKAMHSSSLVSGQVEIDFEKAFAAMKRYFTDGVYTFEIPWDQAEVNKKLIDEMVTKYW